MQQKNIIISSLRETIELIWKNKLLFVLLFILQIIFFILFSYTTLIYQIKMLESAKAITDYINQQNLDEISVASNILQQKSILGEDPLSISRNFNEMVKDFRIYLIYIFFIIIFFASLNWALTKRLIHKFNFKQSAKIFLKILIIALSYFGLIFSFFYSLVNIQLSEVAVESTKLFSKYILFSIISIVLAYFMFVSLSLISKTALQSIVQKTLAIGVRKAHYILTAYFINLFLFVFPIYWLYNFIETNILIFLLSLLVMTFSFIFGRIFLVKVVEKLA